MVRQSFNIYKRDLKAIFTNYAVLITVIALCILPSLYAWINIKASWDPYSSQATSRIKVAVVNNDTGTTLNDKEINVGNEVVEGLKANTLLGWQFWNEKKAMKALEEGEIYAAIIIPANFSTNLTSVVTESIEKPEIKYIVNEKINAIAPKITIKGATGIQSTIGEEVVSTVSNIVLGKAKELGIEVEDVYLPRLMRVEDALIAIQGKFTEVNGLLNTTQDGMQKFSTFLNDMIDYMPQMEKLLIGAKDVVSSIQEFVNTLEVGTSTIAPTIKKDLGLVRDISSDIYSTVEGLEDLIASGSEKAPEVIDNIYPKVDALEKITSAILKILTGIDKIVESSRLDAAITKLEAVQTKAQMVKELLVTLKEKLQNGETPNIETLTQIQGVLEDVQAIASGLYDNFDTEILGAINSIFGKIDSTLGDTDTAITEVQNALPEVLNLMLKAQDILGKGNNALTEIKEAMPQLEEKVIELTDKISKVNKDARLKDLLALLRDNVETRTEFLANATNIVEETIFPMGNYGSQMAPFYSSLAAWVGLTILVSMISVEVEGEYKSHEVYFGKLMTYLTITLVQGLVIALGDLYLLKIYCQNPMLFILGMLYIALCFTFVVYSLVSVFGNVGKVVAIILMIIQVAGSGGTFPVQLTSNFFISVNPYLPFTYAISFLRESIGGVVQSILWKDITVLGTFIAIALVFSLIFKKYINKAIAGFTHKYHEGGL